MASHIPYINLLVLRSEYATAWKEAVEIHKLQDKISYTVHESPLSQLDSDIKFDLIVSPANSYAILDGGFDDAISQAFSLKGDYVALTRHCQSVLYDNYRGFQPPGSCMLIELPSYFLVQGATKNVWGTRFIGHCPTMRTPSDCRWDREVVYECIWTLMCEIDKHNAALGNKFGQQAIRSILMTPLATGTGFVSMKKWANQAVLALKHYIDAVERYDNWKAMNWPEAGRLALEAKKTHEL